ncbi:hypothetical protein B0H66DRAFT_556175 [Apodospora peruviana]|uniref:U6 small nuclear RNA (adenine-(43)-N(6))-methyltransferase n=1 Tax=Apodospora peruviana TaxID=516989 RepID=A0AAE0I5Q4_9PEZI|nr:hypothetical protein B0H66DRAFT_556175 [Apodospora peruviana]
MASRKRKIPNDKSARLEAEVQAPTDGTLQPATAGNGPESALHPDKPGSVRPHYESPGSIASPYKTDQFYRNLYFKEPNFRELARKDAGFARFIKQNGQLDFTDPAAVMQLTKSLLMANFGLKIELPDDRLCPPVPNRHNYILWLKNLLDTSSYQQPGGKLCGLDVGTGASCIYPLLGTAQRPWCFIATDIDARSLSYARQNVSLNGLDNRIRVVQRSTTDHLIPLDDLGIPSIDFVMMNPPFYISENEMLSSANKKSRPPHSACTGAPVEMVCDGGEVAYVGRMVQESLVMRDRVKWYTSMLGKVTSLEALVEQLRANNIDNYAVTEFVQGNKTKRWALGWSFGPMRPDDDAARGIKAAIWKKVLPPVVRMDLLALPAFSEVGRVIKRITDVVGSLELSSWTWETQALKGVGRARENVWCRAWRRKKMRDMAVEEAQSAAIDASEEDCRLGFAILVDVGMAGTTVTLRWVEGHEQSLFESLGGFLQGKLKDLAG